MILPFPLSRELADHEYAIIHRATSKTPVLVVSYATAAVKVDPKIDSGHFALLGYF